MSDIENSLKQIINNKEQRARFKSRIKQIVDSATEESREGKLFNILTESLGITHINKGAMEIPITSELVSKLIKTRNGLFHAKVLTEEEKKELSSLTITLLIICEKIIELLISKATVSL